MIREPIEEKIREKTRGRKTMGDFLEHILLIEESGRQYNDGYKKGIAKAVEIEEQTEGLNEN